MRPEIELISTTQRNVSGRSTAAQQEGRVGLGVEDALERLARLVAQQPVLDDAGAVKHRVEPAVARVDPLDHPAQAVGAGRVGRHVLHLDAALAQDGEVAPHLLPPQHGARRVLRPPPG